LVQNSSMASCGACCFFWGRVDGGGEGGGAILMGTIRLEPRRPKGGGEMDAERLTMETDLGGGERERRRRPMRGPRMADMLAVCRCGGRNDRCSAMNHGLLPSDKWEWSCLRQTCSRQGRSRSAPSLLELPDEDGASSSSPGVVSCTRSSMRDQPNYRTQTFVGDIETKGK